MKALDYLETEHESVAALGITEETCKHFGAGYAPKGIMRGRFAIPIHDQNGTLLAYVGIKQGESPLYPKNFDPNSAIFNAHRLGKGVLTVTRNPLDVLKAHQSGIENVAAFLSDITTAQLDALVLLMKKQGIDQVELL